MLIFYVSINVISGIILLYFSRLSLDNFLESIFKIITRKKNKQTPYLPSLNEYKCFYVGNENTENKSELIKLEIYGVLSGSDEKHKTHLIENIFQVNFDIYAEFQIDAGYFDESQRRQSKVIIVSDETFEKIRKKCYGIITKRKYM